MHSLEIKSIFIERRKIKLSFAQLVNMTQETFSINDLFKHFLMLKNTKRKITLVRKSVLWDESFLFIFITVQF